ncbi:hypothetical protein PCYB_005170 [Plasmodium cynomolgi strain B]|uniref:CYIR protein n=1 Tax=Plasmodium cynomolgi (strain B) TaxID=1120755 RepID=K6UNS6_PLACD|nr:hypothetical protein PCYB_005170 [Plasmodium cynomolgi strain B]GAB69768.1 hypothetical protein PCYB_005170 [Plasmodium cynomolgi strain B]
MVHQKFLIILYELFVIYIENMWITQISDKINPLVNNILRVFKNINLKIYKELNDNNTTFIAVCNYDYNPIDLHRYQQYKLLFDYSKDYPDIERDTRSEQNTCDKDYKKYIEEYINMYNQANSE